MNTQSNSAQNSGQTTQALNDLTLAFAKVCFDYGCIVEAENRQISGNKKPA